MNILTVEDNEINARLMEFILKNLKFKFTNTVAINGEEALDLTSKHHYDLVLMDINLGNGQMDGTEVMNIMRKVDKYKDVPIYAITCYSLEQDKTQFIEAGFNRYFPKPLNHAELIDAISEDRMADA